MTQRKTVLKTDGEVGGETGYEALSAQESVEASEQSVSARMLSG